MRKTLTAIIISSAWTLFLPPVSTAENSVINTLSQSLESIVTVQAYKIVGILPNKPAAAIDPSTGQLIVLQSARAVENFAQGAGVIVSRSGFIATNLHIIFQANKIAVTIFDGSVHSAQIIKLIPEHDLALLKINPSFALKPIEFANSDEIRLKDEIFNIGHSELLNNTFSHGIINGLGTTPTPENPQKESVELIQIYLKLYKGDSGGPVLDRQGRLIGIIAAQNTKKDKATYAIPSNKLKKLFLGLPQ
jgi:S1-C subfamily serine protease